MFEQMLIIWVLIGLAAAYLAHRGWRAWRGWRGQKGGGCAGGCGCASKPAPADPGVITSDQLAASWQQRKAKPR